MANFRDVKFFVVERGSRPLQAIQLPPNGGKSRFPPTRQGQGVRSTKVIYLQKTLLICEAKLDPEEKRRDIFLTVYDPMETIYTDQTGKFLHRQIPENKYQIILHKIDGKSTWIEPMNNKTEGETIMVQCRALEIMRDQGIVPKHQVIKNKILAAYRKKIRSTHMTFQLVPPDDHFCNLADNEIQTWKDHFIGIMIGTAAISPIHLW